MKKILLSLLVVIIGTIIDHNHNRSFENKHATILLVYAFPPTESCKQIKVSGLMHTFKNAFLEQNIQATIIPVFSYLDSFSDQLEEILIKHKNIKITHIIFAGHGASDDQGLYIGNMSFNEFTSKKLARAFSVLRPFIHSHLKIFLYGCSTFKGSFDEIKKKAHLFKTIFPATGLEVFGYENDIYANISSYFGLNDFKSLVLIYVFGLGMFFIRPDLGKAFFSKSHWQPFIALLPTIPIFALCHYLCDKYLKFTKIITKLRQLYYYDNMGTAVAFQGPFVQQCERILGHDYFRNVFCSFD